MSSCEDYTRVGNLKGILRVSHSFERQSSQSHEGHRLVTPYQSSRKSWKRSLIRSYLRRFRRCRSPGFQRLLSISLFLWKRKSFSVTKCLLFYIFSPIGEHILFSKHIKMLEKDITQLFLKNFQSPYRVLSLRKGKSSRVLRVLLLKRLIQWVRSRWLIFSSCLLTMKEILLFEMPIKS